VKDLYKRRLKDGDAIREEVNSDRFMRRGNDLSVLARFCGVVVGDRVGNQGVDAEMNDNYLLVVFQSWNLILISKPLGSDSWRQNNRSLGFKKFY
jgi:hypothetical protein